MAYLNDSHSPLNKIVPQAVHVSCSIKAEPKALPYIGVLFHHVHHVHVHPLKFFLFQMSLSFKLNILESTGSLLM